MQANYYKIITRAGRLPQCSRCSLSPFVVHNPHTKPSTLGCPETSHTSSSASSASDHPVSGSRRRTRRRNNKKVCFPIFTLAGVTQPATTLRRRSAPSLRAQPFGRGSAASPRAARRSQLRGLQQDRLLRWVELPLEAFPSRRGSQAPSERAHHKGGAGATFTQELKEPKRAQPRTATWCRSSAWQ